MPARPLRPLAIASLIASAATSAAAQSVRVRTLEAESAQPVVGAIVALLDSTSHAVARGLTNDGGRIVLVAPRPGTYTLRADRIGHPGIATEPFVVLDTISKTLEMPLSRTVLPELTSVGATLCDRRAGGDATARLWDEIKKSLTASQITTETESAVLAVRRFRRYRGISGTLRGDTTTARFTTRGAAFVTADPGLLHDKGFVQDTAGRFRFFAPDAALLLSDQFLEDHCFQLATPAADQSGLVGLAFRPVPGRRLAEVRGTLWVDRASAELRSLEFEYLNAPEAVQWKGTGGRLDFRRLPEGQWVVGEWYIRTADRLRVERSARDFRPVTDSVVGYLDEGGVATPLGDGATLLEEPGLKLAEQTVTFGELRARILTPDGKPIAGANVTVPGLDSLFTADQNGRFRVEDVPEGPLVIRVVAIGFAPTGAAFRISRDRRLVDTTIVLKPAAQRLAPLEVTGRSSPFVAGRMEDFERRRNAGFGSFLTRAQLAKSEDQPLSTVLRESRGVMLIARAWKCGGGFVAASIRSQKPVECMLGPGCPLSIYVDGSLIYDGINGQVPNIDDYLTDRVEAVEVYRGAGEAPPEFNGTGNLCGSIVIWTRVSQE